VSPLKREIRPASDAPFRVSLGPALLYLDDVRDIYEGLVTFSKEWSKGEAGSRAIAGQLPRIQITALSALADQVEDLEEATRAELDHLSLISQSPKIRIDFWCRGAEIIAESEGAGVRSFIEGVEKFLQGRRNWVVFLGQALTRGVAFLLLPAVFAIMMFVPGLPEQLAITPDTEEYVLLAIVFVTVFYLYYSRYRHIVKVVPVWRKDRRRFTNQTRREIFIALASAAVVGLLGLWAGLLAGK
jgi:hypothetical protein